MNNEPVAWRWRGGLLPYWNLLEHPCEGAEPLYTHPHSEESVKVKELTDEEIDFIFFDLPSGHSIQEFARAILRKAQEK